MENHKAEHTPAASDRHTEDDHIAYERIARALFRFDVLNKLPRTGFLMRGVDRAETVGEHSFSAVILASVLLDELRKRGVNLDGERLLTMVAVHEAGEILTGDMPRPAGAFLGEGGKDRLDRTAGYAALAELPALREVLMEFEDSQTTEAKIAKAVDKLQMLLKALMYESEGKGRMDDFWIHKGNVQTIGIPFIDELFETLRKMRGKVHLDYLTMVEVLQESESTAGSTAP